MNDPRHSPGVRFARATAIAVACGSAGASAIALAERSFGIFPSALFIPPVAVAAWFVGPVMSVVTIVVETGLTLLALSPRLRFPVTSQDEVTRLAISAGVAALTAIAVGYARRLYLRYATIVHSTAEGIGVIDADGRTTFANDALADMLGYTVPDLQGRRFSDFIPPDDVPASEVRFANLKRGVRQSDEVRLVRKDGSVLWALNSATPMLEGGRFIGALALMTDITERKADEALIRQQTEDLQRIDRQKNQFLAMLSHELRNPLAPILAALSVMDAKGEDAFRRERAVIARQADQLRRLVDDLLDVSRFGRGDISLSPSTMAIADWVTAATETVMPSIRDKRLELVVDVPDGATFSGDAHRLTQALVNLLTNAIRYTPAGGHIEVHGAIVGADVVVRVKDDGIGIPREFSSHLFEPFTRDAEAASQSASGLGLGLVVVRGILSAHGGTVTAHSDGSGLGSEFVLRLPVAGRTTSVDSNAAP